MSKHETITENWKYSEFKDTVVELYTYYMNCFNRYADGLQQLKASLPDTRSDFISAMSTFYTDQRGFYLPYLKRHVLPIKYSDYDNLLLKPKDFSDEQIYQMHLEMVTWFNTYGAKALGTEVSVYDNPIEEALAEFFERTNKTKGYAKYYDMQPIYNFLEAALNDKDHGIKKNNQDMFFCVTGRTGIGKSYTLLDIFEHWYREILKVENFDEDFIKYFATTNDQHKQGIGLLKDSPFYMMCHDEAVLTAKRRNWNSKDNRNFTDLFEVIRGMNLAHGVCIPDFSDLEGTFLKRRMDFLILVKKEGDERYAYLYSRYRCRELHKEILENNITPEVAKTLPNFKCRINQYDGMLLKAYQKQKKHGMSNLIDTYSGSDLSPIDQSRFKVGEKIYKLLQEGKGKLESYEACGCNPVRGKRSLELYCKTKGVDFPLNN